MLYFGVARARTSEKKIGSFSEIGWSSLMVWRVTGSQVRTRWALAGAAGKSTLGHQWRHLAIKVAVEGRAASLVYSRGSLWRS